MWSTSHTRTHDSRKRKKTLAVNHWQRTPVLQVGLEFPKQGASTPKKGRLSVHECGAPCIELVRNLGSG